VRPDGLFPEIVRITAFSWRTVRTPQPPVRQGDGTHIRYKGRGRFASHRGDALVEAEFPIIQY